MEILFNLTLILDNSKRIRLKNPKNNIKYKRGNVKILKSAKRKGVPCRMSLHLHVFITFCGFPGKSRPTSSFTRQDALIFSRKTWCQNAKKDNSIESRNSFGKATTAARTIWKDYKCDKLLESKLSMLNPIADCGETHMTLGSNGNDTSPKNLSSYPMISILVAVTTRKIKKPTLRDLDLYTVSMPSLMGSLDCGFRYSVIVGYEVGDPYLDTVEVSNEQYILADMYVETPYVFFV